MKKTLSARSKFQQRMPSDFDSFMLWVGTIHSELIALTGGKVNIDQNKLASIMTSHLPGSSDNFGLDALKALDPTFGNADVTGNDPVTVDRSQFNSIMRKAGISYLQSHKLDIARKIIESYGKIDWSDPIHPEHALVSEFFMSKHELNTPENTEYVRAALVELDPECIEDIIALKMTDEQKKETAQNILERATIIAYNDFRYYLFFMFLDEASKAYQQLPAHDHRYTRFVGAWLVNSFSRWDAEMSTEAASALFLDE